jgi:hypothetical protein
MKKAADGASHDERFRLQIEAQMNRLLQQISDLEEFKDDLEPEEYDETLQDTKAQLVEFRDALDKIREGDVTLLDALGRMRLAIQAAISDAFKTPEVVAMFMKKEPGQLRGRLQQLEQQAKLRKISADVYNDQRIEVLTALQRLGEPLSSEEEHELKAHTNRAMKNFEHANNEIGQSTRAGLSSLAASQNTSAQKTN